MRTKWRPMNIYCRCSSRQITDTRCTAFPRIATLAASRANVGGWRKLARGVDTSDIRFWRRAGVTRTTDWRREAVVRVVETFVGFGSDFPVPHQSLQHQDRSITPNTVQNTAVF